MTAGFMVLSTTLSTLDCIQVQILGVSAFGIQELDNCSLKENNLELSANSYEQQQWSTLNNVHLSFGKTYLQ